MRWAAAAVIALVGLAGQDRPTFRAGTSAIAVDVAVNDGRRTVTGLTAADFELTDNGAPQEIEAASLEHLPFDLTLVVDTSGSLSGAPLAQFKKDIASIGAMLSPNDRFRLVTFATRASDAFGWQPGAADPPVARIAAGGATAFYQAIAASLLRPSEPGRRQLIVALSDGYDTVSFLDAPDVRDLARRADGVLHIVLRRVYGPRGAVMTMRTSPADTTLVSGQSPSDPMGVANRIDLAAPLPVPRSFGWVPYSGPGANDVLRDAAELTGGRLRQAEAAESLTNVFRTALDEFRTSYVLWYTPKGVPASGWHTIRVSVKKGKYTIRHRSGYDAGGNRP